MKFLFRSLTITAFAVALTTPPQLFAQSTNKPPTEKKSSAEKSDSAAKNSNSIPFKGNITTMDKNARTITVGKRTFQVTSETKIFKSDKPATFTDGAVGDYVTGSYKKADDGKLIAHSVYFGGKSSGKGTAEKKKEPAKDSKETKS